MIRLASMPKARNAESEANRRRRLEILVEAREFVVDGVLGPKTYGAMQKWLARPVDGSLSTTDKKALQTKLKVAADGQVGPITIKALQRLVGATPDGVWGSGTTKALQTYLNKVL